MSESDRGWQEDNRAKKVAGRRKRARYVQGTRAFLHAMTNSMAKRAARPKKPGQKDRSG
jgi:hypothetical protein